MNGFTLVAGHLSTFVEFQRKNNPGYDIDTGGAAGGSGTPMKLCVCRLLQTPSTLGCMLLAALHCTTDRTHEAEAAADRAVFDRA